ncbi:acyl-CoA dehydrogenase family protein, partial [Dietzia sp.]|uniref:acyl-CoA dehydrogenase family protein n=1 Tax=Dietzia sp. TaxID=1871616 RepID=UPI002FDAED69
EVVSHISAALVHGLPVAYPVTHQVEVVRPGVNRRYPSLHVRGTTIPAAHWQRVGGMRLTTLERTLVDVARTYTRHVADLYVDGHDAIAEVCHAKNTSVECAEWVADKALQLHGGLGFMEDTEVNRQYRDVRLLGIGGATTEILTTLAARRLGFDR